MTKVPRISAFISRLALSVAVCLGGVASAQGQQFLKFQSDSIPLFRGFAVSFDLVGLLQQQLGDYGQYEGALRLNLHDQYFPTVELGYGMADHATDEVSGISYKTRAPYFRLGADVNLLKQKHTGNRIFAGLRYAYTNYKADFGHPVFPDPVWGRPVEWGIEGQQCYQHWAEVVFGLDAKVAGPLHLGWSVRYRRRLAHADGPMENVWYVPGFGTQGTTRLSGTFNVSIDI